MPIEIHLEKRINNNVVREPDARSHRDYVVVTVFGADVSVWGCLFMPGSTISGFNTDTGLKKHKRKKSNWRKWAGSFVSSEPRCAIHSGSTLLPGATWA